MSTLIIIPYLYHTNFRMKGLKISLHYDLCKDESGFFIDNKFKRDGKTAVIRVDKLVEFLIELKEEIKFDSIKIKGHYEKTGEEIMKMILIN